MYLQCSIYSVEKTDYKDADIGRDLLRRIYNDIFITHRYVDVRDNIAGTDLTDLVYEISVCNLANACDFSVFTGAWMACSKGYVSFPGKEKHDRAAEKCGLI